MEARAAGTNLTGAVRRRGNNERKTMKKSLMMLMAGLMLFCAGCGKGPEDVTKAFCAAVAAGDVDKAMKYVPADEQEMARMGVEKMSEDEKARAGFKKVRILGVDTIDDTHAAVRVELGGSKKEEFRLVKIKGDWKISK